MQSEIDRLTATYLLELGRKDNRIRELENKVKLLEQEVELIRSYNVR